LIAGPHYTHDFVLTFWRYVEPGAKSSDGDRLLGEAVRRFHSALAGIAGELPRLTEKIDQANELLQDAKATPRVTAADRAGAAKARDRLATLCARSARRQRSRPSLTTETSCGRRTAPC